MTTIKEEERICAGCNEPASELDEEDICGACREAAEDEEAMQHDEWLASLAEEGDEDDGVEGEGDEAV